MKRSTLVWVAVISGIALMAFSAVLVIGALLLSEDGGFGAVGGERIAVIPVEGVITEATAREVNRHLKQYGNDSRVKAVLLRVDSPGGGVTASEEIYREVKRLKDEKKKKIVVAMGTTAASGGYYIACSADRIFANSSTLTGSIGVIAEWVNYKGLAEWAKIKEEVFKSGEFKDTGSPTREMTQRERDYFQGIVNTLFNQFIRAVTDGRKGRQGLDEARIRALADGRVYTGEEAKANGLVDEIGGYEDALRETARLVGIKGEPQVVTPPKPRDSFSLLDLLGSTKLGRLLPSQLPSQLSEMDTSVKFKYQWK
ncbi:MAG TPA: signal peptide peptidase SppA [Blastocatellia bacterium]|nr:signal peptide peptidase SppA [Blastocatellia bacterium]